MFGQEYELNLLDLRLEYLNEYVDYFVLVEATFTQTGIEKELYFEKNKNQFEKYLHKIIHIKLTDPVEKFYERDKRSWKNENYQRNQISQGLDLIGVFPDDVIIISDLDEIPNKQAIDFYIQQNVPGLANTVQDLFFYFLNLKSEITWNGSQFIRGRNYLEGMTPQDVRNLRKRKNKLKIHGGWHFSYTGGVNAVLTKINSLADGYHHKDYNDLESIQNLIDRQQFQQKNLNLHKIDIFKELYPETFRNRYFELLEKNLIKE
jgi:beta-1,4-mannosyl-glycoprotein beta-1,4-N-acetylglucosaminyltransferase